MLSPLQSKLQEATKNEPEAFLPRSSEATTVTRLLKHRFPEGRDVPAVVVFATADGQPLTAAQRAAIKQQDRGRHAPGRAREARGRSDRRRRLATRRRYARACCRRDRSTAIVLIPMNPEDSDALRSNVDNIRDEHRRRQVGSRATAGWRRT